MRTLNRLAALFAGLALLASAGCASHNAPALTTADKLIGTWYDDQTGAQYCFASDSVLVVPTPQPGEGNAVTYKLLGDNRLDVTASNSHRVSDIETITADMLVLADPISGRRQPMLRAGGATRYAANLRNGAIRHLAEAASLSSSPDVVWVAAMPTGKGSEWTAWPASSLDTYLQSWDWTGIKKTETPIATAGGGPTMGYSFSVKRQVQSETTLTASWVDTSIEPTAGLPVIDVGYSAAKAEYPAGTLVYLPGGMIYSLGDGYAIAVGRDEKTKTFVPLTHR